MAHMWVLEMARVRRPFHTMFETTSWDLELVAQAMRMYAFELRHPEPELWSISSDVCVVLNWNLPTRTKRYLSTGKVVVHIDPNSINVRWEAEKEPTTRDKMEVDNFIHSMHPYNIKMGDFNDDMWASPPTRPWQVGLDNSELPDPLLTMPHHLEVGHYYAHIPRHGKLRKLDAILPPIDS